MEWKIEKSPSYAVLKIKMSTGEEVAVEPGAYMLHTGDIEVKTSVRGGILSGLARKLAGGESFFLNTIIGKKEAEVWIAPSLPGDIRYIEVKPDNPVYVQDSSFLAQHGNVKLTIAWRGVKGFIAEGQLLWLKIEGEGGVWVNSYGAIEELTLNIGEKAAIDNGHLVAMQGTIDWKIGKIGGLKTFAFGGEGLVMHVKGPGKILVQTRTLSAFASKLISFLPKRG